MGLPGWIIRKVAEGDAPSPYYAAVGAADAAGSLPKALLGALSDPRPSLSGLGSALRSPTKQYDSLVERGYARVVSEGAAVAVRANPTLHHSLAGPARAGASVYAKGRHRMPSMPRRGLRHH